MMRALVLCVVLASASSLAGDFIVSEAQPLGWTQDERFFAWRFTRDAYDQQADTRNGPTASVRGTFFAVVDVVKGQQTVYRDTLKNIDESDLTGNESGGLPALKATFAEWKRLPPKAQFNAWLSKNKLMPGPGGPKCGAATASIERLPGPAPTLFGVTLGNATWKHLERSEYVPQGYGGWASRQSAQSEGMRAVWSPACHYVAWVSKSEGLVFPAGPLVEVLAHPKVEAAVEPTLKALAAGGFGATAKDPAQKERTASVVYAWGGAQEAAEKVAALVPGGATVEPITWVTPADIIVALGTSALK